MPISPDELEHPQEQPDNGEGKSQREIFKQTARSQLAILGYSSVVEELTDHFNNTRKGPKADLDKLLPHIFGNEDDYLNQEVAQMTRIPNTDEAKKLLAAAIFSIPAKRNEDGTITVTSFSVAEPSTTTVQTKVRSVGDKQNDLHFEPNAKGTDNLLRRLISSAGFQQYSEVAETIFQLKKGKNISLPHPSNKSLILEIDEPVTSPDPNSRTAYSYKVQTKLKPA